MGFERAGHNNGAIIPLLQCLSRIKGDYIVEAERQKKIKGPLDEELASITEDIKHKKEEYEAIKKEEIPNLKNKIEALEKEIIVISKPQTDADIIDKMSKISFFIGLIIIIILTIYLFVFYSSASFSAFFKEFTIGNIGVANSIFDPQAITRAYQDGITELILILSMPIIFIGLGFLIHKFQEKKGYQKHFKIGFLILITLIFDAILAYEITDKIHNIKMENSVVENLPLYSFSLAFENTQFWLIIFAGFVVYLIWGLIFNFTMESYDKINVIRQEIKKRKSEIRLYNKEILELNKQVKKLLEERNVLKREAKIIEQKIDGRVDELKKILNQFLSGWIHWMSVNKKEQSDIDHATEKGTDFIDNVKF